MNNKTLEHIERFVDNIKWNIVIKNNEITFDLTCPSVDHLPDKKKTELEYLLYLFLKEHVRPVYLDSALNSFKYHIISQDSCYIVQSFINHKEQERISDGEKSIKDEIKRRIFFFFNKNVHPGVGSWTPRGWPITIKYTI